MKVGVTRDSDTVYYCYMPGTASTYAFTGGNGEYTITLYRNVSGTTYRSVTSTCVDVEMDDPMAPYLASTDEITFSANDTVGQKAAELCSGLTCDGDKVAAIYRYMAANLHTTTHWAGRWPAVRLSTMCPIPLRYWSIKPGSATISPHCSQLCAAAREFPVPLQKGI